MREGLLVKSLAFSLILCFLGASVIPSTGTFMVENPCIQTLDGTILYVGGNGEHHDVSLHRA